MSKWALETLKLLRHYPTVLRESSLLPRTLSNMALHTSTFYHRLRCGPAVSKLSLQWSWKLEVALTWAFSPPPPPPPPLEPCSLAFLWFSSSFLFLSSSSFWLKIRKWEVGNTRLQRVECISMSFSSFDLSRLVQNSPVLTEHLLCCRFSLKIKRWIMWRLFFLAEPSMQYKEIDIYRSTSMTRRAIN